MRKTVLFILILLFLSLLIPAFAEQGSYCDPVPQDLAGLIEDVPQDCIVLNAPDGTVHAYIILEYGSSLEGYRLTGEEWESVISGGDVLNYRSDARFIRHQAGQTRPDGTPYGGRSGFRRRRRGRHLRQLSLGRGILFPLRLERSGSLQRACDDPGNRTAILPGREHRSGV